MSDQPTDERDDRIADLEAANAMMEVTLATLAGRMERDQSLIVAGVDAAIADLQRLRARMMRTVPIASIDGWPR